LGGILRTKHSALKREDRSQRQAADDADQRGKSLNVTLGRAHVTRDTVFIRTDASARHTSIRAGEDAQEMRNACA